VPDVALGCGGLRDEGNYVVTVSPVIDRRYPRLIGQAREGDDRQQNQDGHDGPGPGHLAHLNWSGAAPTLPRTRSEGTVPSLGPDGLGARNQWDRRPREGRASSQGTDHSSAMPLCLDRPRWG
jgi:hypothetical protein